jgi:hypothetical protein
LPNGPVVISPDGLFPSLYREGNTICLHVLDLDIVFLLRHGPFDLSYLMPKFNRMTVNAYYCLQCSCIIIPSTFSFSQLYRELLMSLKLHVWRYFFFSAIFFLCLITHDNFSLEISFNIHLLLYQYQSTIIVRTLSIRRVTTNQAIF